MISSTVVRARRAVLLGPGNATIVWKSGSKLCSTADGLRVGIVAICEEVEASETSEGTSFDTEDTTDAVLDGLARITDSDAPVCEDEAVAVEECKEAAVFKDGDLLLVPRWVAFPRAAEVLQMSFIWLKYGQILPRRPR